MNKKQVMNKKIIYLIILTMFIIVLIAYILAFIKL